MEFLAMIVALVLLQSWGHGGPVQQDNWFLSWRQRWAGSDLAPAWRLVIVVLAPVVLCALVMDALRPALFGLLWIGAAVLVLLYAFGRGHYRVLLERYRAYLRQGDYEGARLAAENEWSLGPCGVAGDTAVQVHGRIQRGLLYLGYQRWFGVLFFFLLLGPAGALGYRLVHLSRGLPGAGRLLFWLDWLPVRLLGAVFTVTGDFVASRDAFLDTLTDTEATASEVLYRVALPAAGRRELSGDEPDPGQSAASQNLAVEELLRRSAGVWVVAISLLEMLP